MKVILENRKSFGAQTYGQVTNSLSLIENRPRLKL